MNLSKEHVLALKITWLLLIFALFITYWFQYLNHDDFNNTWKWYNGYNWKWYNSNNKYIVIFVIALLSYLISYILAKITIRPIEENNKKLKEYNHNLAHEIKTPLAVLKSNIELLEIWFDKELLVSSSEEINWMESIIDSLLFLSENNKINNTEIVNVWLLLDKYVTDNFKLVINDDYLINWNLNLIDRLLKNVIENALKYNKKWEKIIIKLTNNSFSISNKIEWKINSKNLHSLFDTFQQDDNSRFTSWYGLWLSIVKKICDIHKLNVNIVYKNDFFTLTVK